MAMIGTQLPASESVRLQRSSTWTTMGSRLLLGAISLLCIGFDAWLTYHRMVALGNKVELNPIIRCLGPFKGGDFGSISNTIPTILLVRFAPMGLGCRAGLKSGVFSFQRRSLASRPA